MPKPIATRVLEICPGEFVVQFAGGVGGWTTFSDTFATRAEAEDVSEFIGSYKKD